MQKLKFEIRGNKVHDVGYRVLLVNKALSLGVSNFNTFNTYLNGIQAVITTIEADDEIIDEFKDFIAIFRPKEAILQPVQFYLKPYRTSVHF